MVLASLARAADKHFHSMRLLHCMLRLGTTAVLANASVVLAPVMLAPYRTTLLLALMCTWSGRSMHIHVYSCQAYMRHVVMCMSVFGMAVPLQSSNRT